MCLSEARLVKSHHQVVAWKVYRVDDDGNSYSYYYGELIPAEKIVHSVITAEVRHGYLCIEKAIHSFASLKGAKQWLGERGLKHTKTRIYRCIVPGDTVLYRGLVHSKFPGYASGSLIINKQVFETQI